MALTERMGSGSGFVRATETEEEPSRFIRGAEEAAGDGEPL